MESKSKSCNKCFIPSVTQSAVGSVVVMGSSESKSAPERRWKSPVEGAGMASLIESEAVFTGRLKACGLEAYAAEFQRRGWRTLSTFAFSSSSGTGDDGNFVESVVRPILGDAGYVDVPKIRKLYFEAYTMVAADLKSKLDHGPDAEGQKAKKMAPVERKARWEEVKRRYPHLTFTEQLEPAHQVIDKFHGMKAEGELKYLAAHEIPTRDQELRNVKTEELIKRDASGHLRAHDGSKVQEADVRTDLRMRQAYMRKRIAMEIGRETVLGVPERTPTGVCSGNIEAAGGCRSKAVEDHDREARRRLGQGCNRKGLQTEPSGRIWWSHLSSPCCCRCQEERLDQVSQKRTKKRIVWALAREGCRRRIKS